MVQPGTYLETVSAAGACLYKHGRPLSGICSSGSALIRTESGASATAWYLSRDSLGSWRLPL